MNKFLILISIFFGFSLHVFAQEENTEKELLVKINDRIIDKKPDFPGGLNAFGRKIIENIDANQIETDDDVIRGTLEFVVHKNGTVTITRISGGNDSFKEEVACAFWWIKEQWKPAIKEGKPVDSTLLLPIIIDFRN